MDPRADHFVCVLFVRPRADHCTTGKLASWQVGKLASWQVGKLASWQVGKLASWQARLVDFYYLLCCTFLAAHFCTRAHYFAHLVHVRPVYNFILCFFIVVVVMRYMPWSLYDTLAYDILL
jgi:hypothetical protein